MKIMTLKAKVLSVFILPWTVFCYASDTALITVTYSIENFSSISLSGNPWTCNMTTAVAGQQPTPDSDSSTTYNITTNSSGAAITAALAAALPSGVTLGINLQAPPGATSLGNVILSTTPQNVVTGIANGANTGLQITYTMSATTSAAIVSNATIDINYTLQ